MHGDATCPNLIVVKQFSKTKGNNSETLASASEFKLLRTGHAFIVRGTAKRSENVVANRRWGNSIFIGRVVGNDRTGSMLAGIRALDNVIPCAQLPLCTHARVYIQIRTWSACRVSREPLPRYIISRTPSVPGKHRENASSPFPSGNAQTDGHVVSAVAWFLFDRGSIHVRKAGFERSELLEATGWPLMKIFDALTRDW